MPWSHARCFDRCDALGRFHKWFQTRADPSSSVSDYWKKKETGKEGKMTADRPLRIVIPTPGPVTTMTYHMPTQPNPVWQSWWMFASPKSLQKEKRTIKWCNNSRMFASGCIPRSCAAFGDAVNGHQQWTVRKSSVGLCVVDLKDVEITILVRLMDLWNKEMCQLFYYTESRSGGGLFYHFFSLPKWKMAFYFFKILWIITVYWRMVAVAASPLSRKTLSEKR